MILPIRWGRPGPAFTVILCDLYKLGLVPNQNLRMCRPPLYYGSFLYFRNDSGAVGWLSQPGRASCSAVTGVALCSGGTLPPLLMHIARSGKVPLLQAGRAARPTISRQAPPSGMHQSQLTPVLVRRGRRPFRK